MEKTLKTSFRIKISYEPRTAKANVDRNDPQNISDAFNKRREIFYNETYTYAKDRI